MQINSSQRRVLVAHNIITVSIHNHLTFKNVFLVALPWTHYLERLTGLNRYIYVKKYVSDANNIT
jgi:hypothetical protein